MAIQITNPVSLKNLVASFGLVVAFALPVVSLPANAAEQLNVVEMFTSQGCYSCPPADKLLAAMAAEDESILNLEFHVDYWNKLRYGNAGVWSDPFSSPASTLRQQQYAYLKLRGNSGVYTPQTVVNGIYGNVGSDRRSLKAGLKINSPRLVSVSVNRSDDSTLSVDVATDAAVDAQVFLVQFLRETSTDIPSGENHGKVMKNHNVVFEMASLGSVEEVNGKSIDVAYAGGENLGCAILVQHKHLGPILGAARCP